MSYSIDAYKFLVDVNLPKFFGFFNHANFFHVVDINPKMTDSQIWDYALSNEMVILTKDVDFYYRFLTSDQSPKVIYFQLGNMTLKELHQYFKNNWSEIVNHISGSSLIYAHRTYIQKIF